MTRALYLLSAVATVLAWALARQKAEHRPIAILLTVGLATDLLIRALRMFYLDAVIVQLGTDARWTGAPHIAAIVVHALFIAWPATLVGASLFVFLKRRAWPALLFYVACLTAIVALHPIAGDGSLSRALTAIQLSAVAISVGCGLTWYRSQSTEPTSTAQSTLSLIVGIELTTIAFAWRSDVFANWHLTNVLYLILFSILILMQGGLIWQSSRSQ